MAGRVMNDYELQYGYLLADLAICRNETLLQTTNDALYNTRFLAMHSH
jgi:hypothetical protein